MVRSNWIWKTFVNSFRSIFFWICSSSLKNLHVCLCLIRQSYKIINQYSWHVSSSKKIYTVKLCNFAVQLYYDRKKFNLNLKTGRWDKVLWPSQNIWTLNSFKVQFFEFWAHLSKIQHIFRIPNLFCLLKLIVQYNLIDCID